MRGLAASSLAVASLLCACAAARASDGSLVLIHALANEGRSAGGHIALRLGDHVHHFQVRGDRVLRLDRDSWRDFRARYSSLENRALEFARIDVDDHDLERIRRHLEQRRTVQRSQLDALDLAVFEREWAEASRENLENERRGSDQDLEHASVEVEGAGFFAAAKPSGPGTDALALIDAIHEAHGANFLSQARQQVVHELAREWRLSAPIDPEGWSRDRLAAVPATRGELLLEALWLREALDVLASGADVRSEYLVDPIQDASGRGASPDERRWLAREAERLEARIVALVGGRRPDRGRPLLIAIARHRAVSRSLRDGHFWTLSPIPGDAKRVSSTEGPGRAEVVRSLVRDAETRHLGLRERLASSLDAQGDAAWGNSAWGEVLQLDLEIAAARHHELRLAAEHGLPVRLLGGRRLPLPPAMREAPRLLGDDAVSQTKRREQRVRDALTHLYGYDLFERNCATELARGLSEAFPDRERAEAALGGPLAPGGASFFPLALFRQARAQLRTSETWTLPSYRSRRLEALAAREGPWQVALRESNTLSSSIYTPNDVDSAFLLFTDGRVWSRPLFGLTNLVYGAAWLGAGLMSWPVDHGDRLQRGARGAFYSLPELAFINIRKGHFEYNEEISDWVSGTGP